jgi:AcrR family transcriptional regulator
MKTAAARAAPAAKRKKPRATTAAHDDRRIEIIEHCAALFDKVGYHGTSMQMLADDVGLGKPSLYHYFRSKTDILYEMHQTHIDALLEGLPSGDAAEADPAQSLERAAFLTLRQIADHPGYVSAFLDHYRELEGKQRTEMRKRRQEYLARITAIVKGGIDAGRFRDVDPGLATLAFLGMCTWAYKWYPRIAAENPPEKMAKSLCDIFLGGLLRA